MRDGGTGGERDEGGREMRARLDRPRRADDAARGGEAGDTRSRDSWKQTPAERSSEHVQAAKVARRSIFAFATYFHTLNT